MQLQFSQISAVSQLPVQTAGGSSAVCTFNTVVISTRIKINNNNYATIHRVQNSVSSEALISVQANMPLASWQNVCKATVEN